MTTVPHPYQIKCARKCRHFGWRALIADDMGLGKTFESFLVIQDVIESGVEGPFLVICPAGVKLGWQTQALEHMGWQVNLLAGTKPPDKLPRTRRAQQVYIINYEVVQYYLQYLQGLGIKLVVIDECQRIRNSEAAVTKAVRSLCCDIQYILALSGTPLVNRPAELWTTLNLLRPDIWPSMFLFGVDHCAPRKDPRGRLVYKGATNLDVLHEKLTRYCMIRRTKSDVGYELPPVSRFVVPIELEDHAQYQDAFNNFFGWLSSHSNMRAVRASKAEGVTKIGYLRRLVGELKQEANIEWMQQFHEDSDGKLVTFGVHKKVLKPLHEHFKHSILIDGDTSPDKRHTMINSDFKSNALCKDAICNIQAGGTGVNGLQVASTVLFIELDWTPGAHAQATARVDRQGQKEPVFCHYLIAQNTIEEKICEIIQKKQRNLDAVLDGGPSDNALDIYDQLVQSLLNEGE